MKTLHASPEHALEIQLRDLLESVPNLGRIEVSRNPAESARAYDILATIRPPRGGASVELWVECQRQPRPSQFPHVNVTRRRQEAGSRATQLWVLAAPHISERMAQLCEEHGWGWYDLAGNCRLSLPGPIYIERTGFPPVHDPPKAKANLKTAASARVLRTLLVPEHAGMTWTQTSLQQACDPGVSIGLVNKLVRHLRDEAWIVDREGSGFRVQDPVGLLEAWSGVYRFERHRRISYFTLLKPRELEKRLRDIADPKHRAAYALFSAAEHQAPHVRQSRTWIYVEEHAIEDFARQTEAKPVDSGGNMIVLVPEDSGVFYLADDTSGNGLPCTNPVQTYLDLRSSGGRGEEAAEAILNQCLKPAWEGAKSNA